MAKRSKKKPEAEPETPIEETPAVRSEPPPAPVRSGAELRTIADLQFDPQNANRGTTRGAELLRESFDTCGAGRSILVDKHGVVIAGNKTLEAARAQGIDIDVVQTDGHQLVVVQRTDLDLVEDPKARQLAYYDNRVAELDLSWSSRQVKADLLAGVDVGCAFFPEELDALTAAVDPPVAEPMADVVMPAAQDDAVTYVASPEEAAVAEAEAQAPAGSRSTYVIVFENIEQQLRWSAFARALRKRYPDAGTPGARLAAYLSEAAQAVAALTEVAEAASGQ